MKTLKLKFRKIKKKHHKGIVIKSPLITAHLKPIKIKPKQGKWCEYYEGRLPYPMECSNNKSMPISSIFKGSKQIVIKDRSDCVFCKRAPQWDSWKRGDWGKIIEAIKNGENLTDMDPPRQEMY